MTGEGRDTTPGEDGYLTFYSAISQTLFDEGAGDHLHAQQRADYRRGLARSIHAAVLAAGWAAPSVVDTHTAQERAEVERLRAQVEELTNEVEVLNDDVSAVRLESAQHKEKWLDAVRRIPCGCGSIALYNEDPPRLGPRHQASCPRYVRAALDGTPGDTHQGTD